MPAARCRAWKLLTPHPCLEPPFTVSSISCVPCARQLNECCSRLVANHPVSGSFFHLVSSSVLCLLSSVFLTVHASTRDRKWPGVWRNERRRWKMREGSRRKRGTKYRVIGRTVKSCFGERALAKLVPSTGFGRCKLVSVGFVLERSLGYLYREIQFNCLSLVESLKRFSRCCAERSRELRVTLNFNVWTLR